MTDTENLPALPVGWCWTTLGEISKLNPKLQNTGISDDTEVSFLPMKCVQEKNGIFDPSIIKEYQEVKKGYTAFTNGDIIFAKITPCMENGKIAIVDGLKNKLGFGSTEFHVIRVLNEIEKRFIFFYLIREEFRREAKRNMTGSAGQLRVPTNYMHEAKIPLPPLPEQHRIVQKIEELFTDLDAGVQELKKAKVQIKNYRRAVLNSATKGKLTELWREENPETETANILLDLILKERKEQWGEAQLTEMKRKGKVSKDDKWKEKYKDPLSPDTSKLPELPERWTWSRAEQLCHEIKRGLTPAGDKAPSKEGEIPFIKVYNLTKKGKLSFLENNPTFISRETHENKMKMSEAIPGDVLMNITGPPFGKISIVPDTYPMWSINQAIARFRPVSSKYDYKFLCYSLLSTDILARVLKQIKTTAGQQNINLQNCRDMPLPLPPTEEQKVIVSEIERRFSVIDHIEKIVDQSLIQAEKLRQSILKKAFEGKLVPQDPNDEPAFVLLERIKQEKCRAESRKKPEKKTKVKAETIIEISGKTKQAELF